MYALVTAYKRPTTGLHKLYNFAAVLRMRVKRQIVTPISVIESKELHNFVSILPGLVL